MALRLAARPRGRRGAVEDRTVYGAVVATLRGCEQQAVAQQAAARGTRVRTVDVVPTGGARWSPCRGCAAPWPCRAARLGATGPAPDLSWWAVPVLGAVLLGSALREREARGEAATDGGELAAMG
ncbi:hypothetical protein ACF1G5_30770 [Streptomyces coeruleorubidus]|uniref:hypothetical protein n=1 Tax=Streptomyces coeruleorubidus TaxID=116188 RepID=UPI0036F98AB5